MKEEDIKLTDKDIIEGLNGLCLRQKELIDKIKETIRENTIDYALAIDVIIEINDLIKEYEDDSKTNV